MKIISKFTDFYDSVGKQFQGVPGQQVWIREEQEIKDKDLIHNILSELNLNRGLVGYNLFKKNAQELRCESYILAVAGQIYPLVKVIRNTPVSLSETICYDFSELISECSTQLDRYRLKEFYSLFHSYGLTLSIDIWNKLQSPLFYLKSNSYRFNPFVKNVSLVVNPSLKEFEFYRIKDPFTCYQEIDQFLTKLTSPEKEYPQVEDIYRLVEHGFDKKLSFRKRRPG